MTGMGVISKEAVAESRRIINSRNFYVKTDGSMAHSINTDTVKYLMAGMTSSPVLAAKESLHEELANNINFAELPSPYEQEGSPTFKYLGDIHDLNKAWRIIQGSNMQPKQIMLASLSRHLTSRFDFNEADKADLEKPMLVAKINDGYFLLDGLAQLRRYSLGKSMVGDAIVLTSDMLNATFIKNTDGDHEYR